MSESGSVDLSFVLQNPRHRPSAASSGHIEVLDKQFREIEPDERSDSPPPPPPARPASSLPAPAPAAAGSAAPRKLSLYDQARSRLPSVTAETAAANLPAVAKPRKKFNPLAKARQPNLSVAAPVVLGSSSPQRPISPQLSPAAIDVSPGGTVMQHHKDVHDRLQRRKVTSATVDSTLQSSSQPVLRGKNRALVPTDEIPASPQGKHPERTYPADDDDILVKSSTTRGDIEAVRSQLQRVEEEKLLQQRELDSERQKSRELEALNRKLASEMERAKRAQERDKAQVAELGEKLRRAQAELREAQTGAQAVRTELRSGGRGPEDRSRLERDLEHRDMVIGDLCVRIAELESENRAAALQAARSGGAGDVSRQARAAS
jgi:hypothetical protein